MNRFALALPLLAAILFVSEFSQAGIKWKRWIPRPAMAGETFGGDVTKQPLIHRTPEVYQQKPKKGRQEKPEKDRDDRPDQNRYEKPSGSWRTFVKEVKLLERYADDFEDKSEHMSVNTHAKQLHNSVKNLNDDLRSVDSISPSYIGSRLRDVNYQMTMIEKITGFTDREGELSLSFEVLARQLEKVNGLYARATSSSDRSSDRGLQSPRGSPAQGNMPAIRPPAPAENHLDSKNFLGCVQMPNECRDLAEDFRDYRTVRDAKCGENSFGCYGKP